MSRSSKPWRDGTGAALTRQPSIILPSVTIVLYDERQRVLCEQRADNGWWALPGGGVQIGESVHKAAVRELHEETGYLVDEAALWLTGVYSDPEHYACSTYLNRTVHYVNLTFLVDYQPGDIEPQRSVESIQVWWCSVTDLPMPFMPSHRLRLEDALDNRRAGQKYPVVR